MLKPEPFTIFICSPWESYIAQLVEENEAEMRQQELELDLEREEELAGPLEVPVQLVPIDAIFDWDAYAGLC